MHYWAALQSVHEFRCYDNIALTRNVSECSVLAVCVVKVSKVNRVKVRASVGISVSLS